MLRSIVKKSLLPSGLSLYLASRRFHKQLSVRLWQYNSRMISDILDLVIVDYLLNYSDIATWTLCASVLRADICYLCYLYYIQIYVYVYIYIYIDLF